MYRFAVAEINGVARLVVEQQDMLLPLVDILTQAEHAALAGGAADLGVLLTNWDEWEAVLPARVADAAPQFTAAGLSASLARFKPPIAAPRKLICIGSNYHDHIAEMKIPMIPTYPYSFLKPADNTLRGSGEPVTVPHGVQMMDWEAELAVIIGRRASNVPAAGALGCVAGYANFNDLRRATGSTAAPRWELTGCATRHSTVLRRWGRMLCRRPLCPIRRTWRLSCG